MKSWGTPYIYLAIHYLYSAKEKRRPVTYSLTKQLLFYFFQAQDRCHRIGQTRDVHIYRLISEKTIEENILKKANQKRLLGDLAIEGGNFTTAHFKKVSY